jgi:hypothetical protein
MKRAGSAALLLALGLAVGAQAADRPDGDASEARYGPVLCKVDYDGFQRDCAVETPGARPSAQHANAILLDQIGRRARVIEGTPAVADTPLAFRGWWVDPDKDCAAWADDSQLLVGVNLVQFYAGEGHVVSVRQIAPDEVEIGLSMHTDPGDEPTLHLKLSAQGDRLRQMDLDNGYERRRCPGWP